jgi:hypothetical protein
MSSNSSKQIETMIQVIQFSGNKEDFEAWLEEFKAKGKQKGFNEHYVGNAREISKSVMT